MAEGSEQPATVGEGARVGATAQPLVGLRVVGLTTHPSGALTTGILADYGADVILVEQLDERGELCSGPQRAVYHRGKRSRPFSGTEPENGELDDLIALADVIVYDSQTAQPLRSVARRSAARHAGIVTCELTGGGTAGPYAGCPMSEAIAHATIGTMYEQVGHREGPIFEASPFATIGAAHLAAIGVLAAIYRRGVDGIGRHVETSLIDGALAYHAMFWVQRRRQPEAADRAEGRSSGRLVTGSFLCQDGEYIGVHTGAVGAFGRLMRLLGLEGRVQSSEHGMDIGEPLTPEEQRILGTEIHEIFAQSDRAAWETMLRDADVCGIPVLRPGEVFDEPQARHNAMVVTLDDPELGTIDTVAPPIAFEGRPRGGSAGAPRSGEDPGATFDHTSTSHSKPAAGPADVAVLDGVTILDLGAYFAGPYASRLLADLGADVVKLEPPAGDPLRGLPDLFCAAQAGKRAIALDLRDPASKTFRDAVLGWADIVHHNMRPGAAERLGVGIDDARRVNPDVIYGHAPGWGSGGPYALRQSFEPMMSGYVGVGFEVAGAFNAPLYPAGNADPGNGLVGAVAMMVSLVSRQRTGLGTSFQNAQLDATMAHVAHIVRDCDGRVLGAGRLDPLQTGVSALDRLYETLDGWICISVPDNGVAAFRRAVGLDEDHPATDRAADPAELDYQLATAIGDRIGLCTTDEWLDVLADAGVPVARPTDNGREQFFDNDANGSMLRWIEVDHPAHGRIRQVGRLVRVSDHRPPTARSSPMLGEHSAELRMQFGGVG